MKIVKSVNWGKLGLEFLSIIVGIFLALLANDYYQKLQNRKLGKQAMGHIRQEIMANKSEIETKLPHVKAIQNLVQQYTDLEGRSLMIIIGEMNQQMGHGFEMPVLQRGEWESAKSSGIVKHIPYHVVRELSQMSSMEDMVKKRGDRMLELIYNPDIVDGDKTEGLLVTAKLLIGDNLDTLAKLVKAYERILAILAKELK